MKTIVLVILFTSTRVFAVSEAPGLLKVSCFTNGYRSARLQTDHNLLQITDNVWDRKDWSNLERFLGTDNADESNGFRIHDEKKLRDGCTHLQSESKIFACDLWDTEITLLSIGGEEIATVPADVHVEQGLRNTIIEITIHAFKNSEAPAYSELKSDYLTFDLNANPDDSTIFSACR